MKRLVAVAHPDDESLWCGGFLAANPGTHVACCVVDTRQGREMRVPRFYQACKILGAEPFIVAGQFKMWGVDTAPILAFASTYDEIITHNHLGEYGHPAHKMLHEAMRSLGKPIRFFNYGITAGEPIDYERKLEALRCYKDQTMIDRLGQQFDLTREALLS